MTGETDCHAMSTLMMSVCPACTRWAIDGAEQVASSRQCKPCVVEIASIHALRPDGAPSQLFSIKRVSTAVHLLSCGARSLGCMQMRHCCESSRGSSCLAQSSTE